MPRSDMAKKDETSVGNSARRRKFLKTVGAGTVAGLAGCAGGGGNSGGGGTVTGVSDEAQKYADELSWLGWGHYDVADIIKPFEEKYDCTVTSSYFDANSSAYNKLKTGGAEDFDVVMADGFWTQLYYEQDLIETITYDRISNIDQVHPEFLPPERTLMQVDDGMVAAPNCFGGFGFTYNTEKIDPEDSKSLRDTIFNEKYEGHISTSQRTQLNVATTGIMLGYNDPKGSIWEMCDDSELEQVKQWLITQKEVIPTRWQSTEALGRLFRSGQVWAALEGSGAYRRLVLDGLPYEYRLAPEEGALGWVDQWAMTKGGAASKAKRNLVYEWINWRLKPENMETIATDIGWAPTVDIRPLVNDRVAKVFFQDKTEEHKEVTQFDTPKCPGKWETIWNEMQQA